jgi:uncharacterized protein
VHPRMNTKHVRWLWGCSAQVCGDAVGIILILRRLKFLFKALMAYKSVRPLLEASHESPLGRFLLARPQSVGAVIWPYQCAGWNVHTRLARILDHYSVVEEIGAGIDFSVDREITLLDLSQIKEGFRVILDQSEWFMREGQLALSFFVGEVRIYVLAFSLFHTEGSIAAFVGAIQGRDIEGALETYKELTKACCGMRPRDLLIEIFRMLCAELGVAIIFAVADEYRHHRSDYFGPFSAKKFTANYNEIWADRGGTRVDPMYYRLAVNEERRDIASVQPKKRSLYRRRFEMLRGIQNQLQGRYRRLAGLKGI